MKNKTLITMLIITIIIFLTNINNVNAEEDDGKETGNVCYSNYTYSVVCTYKNKSGDKINLYLASNYNYIVDIKRGLGIGNEKVPGDNDLVFGNANTSYWNRLPIDSSKKCISKFYVINFNTNETSTSGNRTGATYDEIIGKSANYLIYVDSLDKYQSKYKIKEKDEYKFTGSGDINFKEHCSGSYHLSKIEIDDPIDCSDLINTNSNLASDIKMIFDYIRILVPILVIGLGIVDFSRAVFSSKEEEMKKAQATFVKRLIIALLIFLAPSLIKLVINVSNSAWKNGLFGKSTCGL